MKRLFVSLLAACSLTMNAQTEVLPYRPGVTENGITYFLPATCLHLTVTAKRVTHSPGEYSKYAERYLRLEGVTMYPYDTWEITGVNITPFGVADTKRAYSVKLKAKTSAPLVGLAPDGRLLSINAEAPELEKLSMPSVSEPTTTQVTTADYMSEEIILAGSGSKMAELAADEIFDIRENRSLLAKGQADFMPKDGEQLKLMLKSLDDQERGLLQLFKGYTTTEEHTFTFDYIPSGEVENHLLFRFSKHLGFVAADDLSGAPVTISIRDLKSLPPVVETTDKKKKKEIEDVRYILPGRAEVQLRWGNKKSTSLELPMSQFGRLEHLGGDLFNKQFTTKVIFSPDNGGIQKIDMKQPE